MSRLAKIAFWVEAAASQLAGIAVHFLTPIAPFIALTTFLVFADQFTGRRASRKRGEPITSRKMLRTVEKLALYLVVILAAEGVYIVMLQKAIPMLHITYGIMAQICAVELKSNVENLNTVIGTKISIAEGIRSMLKK